MTSFRILLKMFELPLSRLSELFKNDSAPLYDLRSLISIPNISGKCFIKIDNLIDPASKLGMLFFQKSHQEDHFPSQQFYGKDERKMVLEHLGMKNDHNPLAVEELFSFLMNYFEDPKNKLIPLFPDLDVALE